MEKQEIINKWVAALRSGEYKQGQGKLKFIHSSGETRYCCLGVLCEVMGIENDPHVSGSAYRFIDPDNYQACYAWLPAYVAKKLNISPLGDFKQDVSTSKGNASSLSYMNDGLNLDFNQIADIIEKVYAENGFTPHSS